MTSSHAARIVWESGREIYSETAKSEQPWLSEAVTKNMYKMYIYGAMRERLTQSETNNRIIASTKANRGFSEGESANRVKATNYPVSLFNTPHPRAGGVVRTRICLRVGVCERRCVRVCERL